MLTPTAMQRQLQAPTVPPKPKIPVPGTSLQAPVASPQVSTQNLVAPTPPKIPTDNLVAPKPPEPPKSYDLNSYLVKPTQDGAAYDLRRQQIESETQGQLKSQRAAMERQLTGKGINDSGIALGQDRSIKADVLGRGQQRLGGIDIQQLEDQKSAEEKAMDRALALRGQDINKDLGLAGIDVTKRGQDINQNLGLAGLDVTKRGQDISADLAKRGLSLQESAQELTRQGMNQQDAQYYAGLGQAKYLAEKGLSLEQMRVELTRQGMSQEDARFYAQLSQNQTQFDSNQKFSIDMAKLLGQDAEGQATRIYLSELLDSFDPKDPNFKTKLYDALKTFAPNANLGVRPTATAGGAGNPDVPKNPTGGEASTVGQGDVQDGYYQGYYAYKEPGGRRYYLQGGSGGRKIYI